MPVATSTNGNGNGHGATRTFKWLAANDVTAEVGGEANVEHLKRTSYDFSSMSPSRPKQTEAASLHPRGD